MKFKDSTTILSHNSLHRYRTLVFAGMLVGGIGSHGLNAAEPPPPPTEVRAPHLNQSDSWKPVVLKVQAPTRNVTLADGIWRQAFEGNVKYLLSSYTVDDMLYAYRKRMGIANPPGRKPEFMEAHWPGTCSGRCLMGSGSALQWEENAQLRKMMDAVVDGVEAYRLPNGYCMAPKEGDFFGSDSWNYCLYPFTIGMIAAHNGGNQKALRLIRDNFDWYNNVVAGWPVGKGLKYGGHGYQGILAPTFLYYTSLGKVEDMIQAERQFVSRPWMKLLIARDPDAYYRKTLPGQHSNIASQLIGMLDVYRATGDSELLFAVRGGCDIMREHYQHVGGTIAICEGGNYPPKCYPITSFASGKHVGELCASVHWLRTHQRLHQFEPDNEAHVTEMERAIYNAVLPGVALDGKGHQYHNLMEGKKSQGGNNGHDTTPYIANSCCEGMGSFACGNLPSFIYSIAPDGLYVDLFAASSIRWQQQDQSVILKMETKFPDNGDVALQLSLPKPAKFYLHVRCPSWAVKPVEYKVNGQIVGTAQPGSYFAIERTWSEGDKVTFHLPMGFRAALYKEGLGLIPGKSRYGIEYGPLLMAAVGSDRSPFPYILASAAESLSTALTPVADKRLHFAVNGNPDVALAPYLYLPWDERYTCYPILESPKNQK